MLSRLGKLALVIIVLSGILYGLMNKHKPLAIAQKVSADDLLASGLDKEGSLTSYARLMNMNRQTASLVGPDTMIDIPPGNINSSSPDAELEIGKGSGDEIRWKNEGGWVEWTFDVPVNGLFELQLEYSPLKGTNSPVIRGIQIDGNYPFAEAEHITLERYWKDEKFPYDRNEIGNQIRPVQVELGGWKTKSVSDFRASSDPLLFSLNKGKHTLRMIGEREPVAFRAIRFKGQHPILAYQDYLKDKHADTQAQWHSIIEAEQYVQKSSVSIQTAFRSEPNISPEPNGRIVYNVLGGERWRNPGEWVEWKLDVPQTGWYELDLKEYQGYLGGFTTYRTISFDGKVPFREMLHFPIKATDNFEINTIKDDNGTPYKFFLEKGAHVVRLTADASLLEPALLAVQNALSQLSDFDRQVRLITGNYNKGSADNNMDTKRTWDLVRFIPNTDDQLKKVMERLQQIKDYLDALNQKETDLTQAIKESIDILQRMRDDVNDIPNRINDLSKIQSNIGTWLSSLLQEPVLLDYLVVRTPGTTTDLKSPTTLSRIPYALINFTRSFNISYDMIGHQDKDAITVWVTRGKDYVNLLKEMVDQDFTPRTGIKVNINLMPNPNMLILGNAAGQVPDVALGVGESVPADYAMRAAVADLSTFSDFEEVNKRFLPGTRRALTYNGGTYGLPEVQNFNVMFYRSDIFDKFHLKVPDTWEDVYTMLPTLQENGMTMFYPKSDFLTLFYQNGEDFYSSTGLNSNLGSDAALKAFKQWTNLFSKYNLPIDVPAFFNHFRDGDIPIGIGDFNTYVQLLVAAPDIIGHWKIAPLPGIKQPNGEVARWSAQGLSAGMIMKKSAKQEQAWQFLKWWTSDEVQLQYANDIESFYGLEYRWNTANLGAMSKLAWPSNDAKAIREQLRWAKNMAYVPGYYFLSREMDFAWNQTVIIGKPPKEALELANVDLQREMDRRQEGFGIDKHNDLRIPVITKPYDWGVLSK